MHFILALLFVPQIAVCFPRLIQDHVKQELSLSSQEVNVRSLDLYLDNTHKNHKE